jgi:TM2 domain-containing membrane protein YozV
MYALTHAGHCDASSMNAPSGWRTNKETWMKRKGVAVALSGLVFPGAGQYYLGRKLRALLFFVLATVCGVVYLNHQLDTANALVGQVMNGSLGLDPAVIEAKIAAQPTPLRVTLAGIVFLLCWAGSVLEIWLGPQPSDCSDCSAVLTAAR